jgi:hypothetical protein
MQGLVDGDLVSMANWHIVEILIVGVDHYGNSSHWCWHIVEILVADRPLWANTPMHTWESWSLALTYEEQPFH